MDLPDRTLTQVTGGGGWAWYGTGRVWLRVWKYVPMGDGTSIRFEVCHVR